MNLKDGYDFDVIVVGGGTAALCAAIAAREQDARILLMEKSPKNARGGNGRYTKGGVMVAHEGIKDKDVRMLCSDLPENEIDSLKIPAYSQDDYYALLMRVSQGLGDPALCERMVKDSKPAIMWLHKIGVKMQMQTALIQRAGVKLKTPEVPGIVMVDGAGEGFVNQLFDIAEKKGVQVRYETKAVKLLMNDEGKVIGVRVKDKRGFKDIRSGSVVLASGSFESSPEMRTKYLGAKWDTVKLRGTRYNTGETINMALEIGTQSAGAWSRVHAIMVDLNTPDVGGGAETGRSFYLFGIMVNTNGERFVDEGEDFSEYTYSKMGGLALDQPGGIVFQIFDAKTTPLLPIGYHDTVPIEANSIEELAGNMDIDPEKLVKTIKEFNNAVQDGTFNTMVKDGKRTKGISPPKTNWALKIDKPPFAAYPVTAGISCTFGGIKVDKETKVLDTEGNPIPGLYAAGAITGGIYYYAYAPATGITKNVVFGRIAGVNAANSALTGQ